MKHIKKLGALTTILVTAIGITACGGSDSDEVISKVKEEYDRIEDDVKDEYARVEDKLSPAEKDMATILESIFLPENADETLDKFLDKITPEGGKGGLYAGHFVELEDGNNSDIDIGAVYFDISEHAAGSVDGHISYQQAKCQNNTTLSTDSAIKVDNFFTGKLSGSLDTPEFLDIKYIRDLDIATPNILSTFSGKFNDKIEGKPWTGAFEYQDGLGGKELSSGKDNCKVTYTLSQRSNFAAYPLDFKRGDLDVKLSGIGTTKQLNWSPPLNTHLTLIGQINVNKAETGANGYVVNQVIQGSDTNVFNPMMTADPTNYAFVVQVFDSSNRLIGFESTIADLPDAK